MDQSGKQKLFPDLPVMVVALGLESRNRWSLLNRIVLRRSFDAIHLL
jgi:hypothetical protein